jgi:hypothetical protein
VSDVALCQFIPGLGHDNYSYHAALAALWDHDGPLVNIEHDMEYSLPLIEELLDCPHPLCTHAYLLYEPTTREAEPHYAQSYHPRGHSGTWVERGVEWALWSGIGFCMIMPEVRAGPLDQQPWMGVEISVNEAVQDPWHVHWPGVEHFHKEPR